MYIFAVVPFVGTWIEIAIPTVRYPNFQVVPFVGTWIEIPFYPICVFTTDVVPFVGTWIEIQALLLSLLLCIQSYPLWVRGLKCYMCA